MVSYSTTLLSTATCLNYNTVKVQLSCVKPIIINEHTTLTHSLMSCHLTLFKCNMYSTAHAQIRRYMTYVGTRCLM